MRTIAILNNVKGNSFPPVRRTGPIYYIGTQEPIYYIGTQEPITGQGNHINYLGFRAVTWHC